MSDISHAIAVNENGTPQQRHVLWAASTAHAVHDGLTDLIYVLLPVWQTQFALSYAVVGVLRGLYSGVMATMQIPASKLARRFGRKRMLVGGTLLSGVAYLFAGQAAGLAGLCIALVLGGLGASTQHPLASSLVASAYEGGSSRKALANYNFAGDIGKMLIPALVALLLSVMSWRQSVSWIGVLGILAALVLARLIPVTLAAPSTIAKSSQQPKSQAVQSLGKNFYALLATGVIDTSARMAYLTFLPFLLTSKGANSATIGLALSLLFVGGAAGKLACGYLGAKIGMMKTVWLTELSTAAVMLLSLVLPLYFVLALLPVLGVVLNGTSSVLYGTVPDLVSSEKREHAFALFYTGIIGGGALAPIVFGMLSDHVGIPLALESVATMLLLTVPLAWLATTRN